MLKQKRNKLNYKSQKLIQSRINNGRKYNSKDFFYLQLTKNK